MKQKFTFNTRWAAIITKTLPTEHDRLMLYQAVVKILATGEIMPLTPKQQETFDMLNIKKPRPEKKREIDLSKPIEQRSLEFKESLEPFVDGDKSKNIPAYGRDMIFDFYRYYSEPNHSNTLMKFEMMDTWCTAGRLVTWYKKSGRYGR